MIENKTAEEALLEQVEAAISAILAGGQSYKIGSRSLTRADLAELKTMREDLKAQICAAKSSPLMEGTVVAFFDGR